MAMRGDDRDDAARDADMEGPQGLGTPQQTRVESLFHLVREGSTADIRINAAERLGEIARQAEAVPCRAILRQLRELAAHEEWDVRVAAAHGMGALARLLRGEKPTTLGATRANTTIAQRIAIVSLQTTAGGDGTGNGQDTNGESGVQRINHRTVDLERVLRDGAPLLRSGGEEYQYEVDLDPAARRRQVLRQRRLLLQRLCGGEEGRDDPKIDNGPTARAADEVAIWKTREDAMARQMLPRLNADHVKELTEDIEASEAAVDDSAFVNSATALKRPRVGELIDHPRTKKWRGGEQQLDDHLSEGCDEIPQLTHLAGLVVDLLESVFDSNWEARHGAFLALRQVFLCSGFMQSLQVSKSYDLGSHLRLVDVWLEESLMRCLCVLALDQFVDYSADGSVAPVRELCAQVLGILLGSFQSNALISEYLGEIRKLVLAHDISWHASHGGFLGLKYLIHAHRAHGSVFVPMIINDIRRPISECNIRADVESEDLLVVAAEILGDVTDRLSTTPVEAIVKTAESMWAALTHFCKSEKRGLGLVAAGIIQALSRWYSNDTIRKLLQTSLEVRVVSDRLEHIFPLLHHPHCGVRIATASCLANLFTDGLHRCFESPVTDSDYIVHAIRDLLPRLLLQILRESETEASPSNARGALAKTWRIVTSACVDAKILDVCVRVHLRGWISLVWSVEKANSILSSKLSCAEFHDEDSDLENLSMPVSKENAASRIAYANALGYLASILPVSEQCVFVENVRSSLASFSGEMQCGALLLLSFWARYTQDRRMCGSNDQDAGVCHELGEQLETMSKNDWIPTYFADVGSKNNRTNIYYAEQVPSLKRVQRMQERLIEIFSSGGIHVQPAPAPPNLRCDNQTSAATLSRAIAEHVAQLPFTQLGSNPTSYEQAHFRRQDLFLVDEIISLSHSTTYARIQGLGSCAYCAILPIPTKKSGFLVKAMMESIKTESESAFFELVAKTVADFVVSQAECQRKCVGKIVSNLVNSAVALTSTANAERATTDKIPSSQLKDDTDPLRLVKVRVKNAEQTLKLVCQGYSNDIFGLCPALESAVYRDARSSIQSDDNKARQTAHILTILAPAFSRQSLRRVIDWIETDFSASLLEGSYDSNETRRHLALMIAALTKAAVSHDMFERILRALYDNVFIVFRSKEGAKSGVSGAIMTLDALVSTVGNQLTPYIPSLVRYSMAVMYQGCEETRDLGAKVFGEMMPLLPLQMDLELSNKELIVDHHLRKIVEENEVSRDFLDGLLHGRAIRPVDVSSLLHPTIELRDYQRHGVNWLSFLVHNNLGGVLADDMGLGKTLQVLSVVANRITSCPGENLSVIVCPPIVVHHWIAEAQRCFPSVLKHILDYTGSSNERKLLRERGRRSGGWLSASLTTPTVIVTTYAVLRSESSLWKTLRFQFAILDEAHLIRNPSTALFKAVRTICAQHRIVLSGTPLQNHVGDIWSLFEFLMPGYLGAYPEFRQQYVLPIARSRERQATPKAKETAALALNQLHQRVLPFILRRTKEEVLTELPPKIISNILTPMTSIQEKVYNEAATSEVNTQLPDSTGISTVLRNLQILQKICVHPMLANEESLSRSRTQLPQKERSSLADWKSSGKLIGLRDLLVDSCDFGSETSDDDLNSGHRCLIFAHHRDTLDLVERMFSQVLPRVTYRRIDGQTPHKQRAETVQCFNKDPSIDILLLTTAVGGLGLTLTGADTVIFLEHSWNPFVDLQAMDRAHRIGQTRTVRVFRIIMVGTLEEHVMDLQRFKQQVASTVVATTEASKSMNASTTQVLELLRSSSRARKVAIEAREADDKPQKEPCVAIPGVSVELLNQIGELWDESQYDTLAFPSMEDE